MRPAREYSEIFGGPLPIRRLVQIWRSLPEGERLSFYHALREDIADRVMEAAAQAPNGRNQQQRAALTSATGAVAPDQHAR